MPVEVGQVWHKRFSKSVFSNAFTISRIEKYEDGFGLAFAKDENGIEEDFGEVLFDDKKSAFVNYDWDERWEIKS